VVCIHNAILFSHKEEWDYVICRKINETIDHHIRWNKPFSQRHVFSHVAFHGEGHESKRGTLKEGEEGEMIRQGNRGGEYDQSTLYACTEMS
jgi:hypothetical protein